MIDACKPFRRLKSFPVVARSSRELDGRIRAKWGKDLPKGARPVGAALVAARLLFARRRDHKSDHRR